MPHLTHVAQRIEHKTSNFVVVGSIPIMGTREG